MEGSKATAQSRVGEMSSMATKLRRCGRVHVAKSTLGRNRGQIGLRHRSFESTIVRSDLHDDASSRKIVPSGPKIVPSDPTDARFSATAS